jgi:hypothetical protein
VFTDDALDAIYRATDGIPRLINQVCDHALLLAYAGGVDRLNAAGIEEAWSDLQQLPTPWSSAEGAPAVAGSADIIEFGQLDADSSEDLPAALPFSSVARKASAKADLSANELENAVEIAAAEDDFQPAGSIRPEVELTFESLSTPFHTFDEEEVVLDRYTSIERDALANRPLVRGPESRELSAMLSSRAPEHPPVVAIGAKSWPGGTPTTVVNDNVEPTSNTASQPAPSHDFTFNASDATSSSSTSSVAQQTSSKPAVSSQPACSPEADDDLIVIEEPADRGVVTVNTPKPAVRRQEYRQLFAQLRRG